MRSRRAATPRSRSGCGRGPRRSSRSCEGGIGTVNGQNGTFGVGGASANSLHAGGGGGGWYGGGGGGQDGHAGGGSSYYGGMDANTNTTPDVRQGDGQVRFSWGN
ncbi:MAG: hypothetical protein H6713_18180 [Myxococcales bacterium]|nr:hypothetical protein [Myxococcales bacterium]MCB9751906.1 hypothetical protein [Myxococcales bacterium]